VIAAAGQRAKPAGVAEPDEVCDEAARAGELGEPGGKEDCGKGCGENVGGEGHSAPRTRTIDDDQEN